MGEAASNNRMARQNDQLRGLYYWEKSMLKCMSANKDFSNQAFGRLAAIAASLPEARFENSHVKKNLSFSTKFYIMDSNPESIFISKLLKHFIPKTKLIYDASLVREAD